MRKPRGRNLLARAVHFQTGAGTHGGGKRQIARRRRRRDRQEEREARREAEAESDPAESRD
jgi:hypothetical protein